MTKVDEEVLASLPRGKWFTVDSVPHRFRCPEHRLQRLVEAGQLEENTEGVFPNIIHGFKVREEPKVLRHVCVEDLDPVEGAWRRRQARERGEIWP